MQGKIKLYNHWGFLELDHQIGKYYRSLFKLSFGLKLQRPSNEEHITIVSPEDGILLSELHHLNGTTLSSAFNNVLYSNGNALWLDVISKDIEDFRKSIGLSPAMMKPCHFCIGYLGETEMSSD